MKAIYVHPGTRQMSDGTVLRDVFLYADSAIARDTMPLFLPVLPFPVFGRVCLAFRVNRMGKRISPKFAMRYLDGVSAMLLMLPATDNPDTRAFFDSGTAAITDSMVNTGRWLEIPADGNIRLQVGDKTAEFNPADLDLTDTVKQVSRSSTLKSGDALILEIASIDTALTPDTFVTASINGQQCLNLKIK